MTISRPLLALAAALLVPHLLPAQACLAAPRTAPGWVGARVARTSDHENLFGADAGFRVGSSVRIRGQCDHGAFDAQTPTRSRGVGAVRPGSRSSKPPVGFSASAMITKLGGLSV